ncbi:MAG: DUF4097 domain-containing protein [Calditrichaeota bacterium]|nr:DUF4097 domain-containing protein [Calditrichota bacterium]
MKRLNTAILLVFLLISGFLFADNFSDTFQKTLPADGVKNVRISTTNGSVTVSTWDKNEIGIVAYKKVKGSEKDKKELLKEIEVKVEKVGDELKISAIHSKRESGGLFGWLMNLGIGDFEVDFEITVPAAMNIEAHSTNGEIVINDVEGRLNASTTNGSIKALRIRNTADISSTNGEIKVYYSRLPEKGDIEIATTNGEIELILPENARCSIDAYTNNGEIECELPNLSNEYQSKRRFKATSKEGGPKLSLKTTNGDINILSK